MAKGSGLVIDPDSEIRYAGSPLALVPRVHLFRLLQWVILRSKGEACPRCGDHGSELTLRLVHPDASLTRGNLQLRCYNCVGVGS
jgi:hypothetical protein